MQHFAHQHGDAGHAHLFLDLGAVHIHGFHADVQLPGNHLAGLAIDHQHQHFTLATGQQRQLALQVPALLLIGLGMHGGLQRCLDAVDHLLRVVGLLDEVQRAVLHRRHRHRNVTMGRDEDGRQGAAALVEDFLQLKTAGFRHAHIQHQAGRLLGIVLVEELVGAGKALRLHADRLQQPGQRSAQVFVVVNDVNNRFAGFHQGLPREFLVIVFAREHARRTSAHLCWSQCAEYPLSPAMTIKKPPSRLAESQPRHGDRQNGCAASGALVLFHHLRAAQWRSS